MGWIAYSINLIPWFRNKSNHPRPNLFERIVFTYRIHTLNFFLWNHNLMIRIFRFIFCLIIVLLVDCLPLSRADAQTLDQLPGYGRYRAESQKRFALGRGGRIQNLTWSADFSRFSFSTGKETKTVDLKTGQFTSNAEFKKFEPPKKKSVRRRSPVPRAEQRKIEPSNQGNWDAVYQNYNVLLRDKKNPDKKIPVTTKGNEKLRYGTCCWVYGEELDQQTAMWWSPRDRFLAFYEVSESHMQDYYLTIDNTKRYTRLHTVRYPKAGDPNPKVSILVYELATAKTVRATIPGEPMQYLYNVRWTPDGSELLVNRTNRRQNKLDVLAVNPLTGGSRIVVTETQDTWQNNAPEMVFLDDGKRFIWETEKNGWKNYELRDLSGRKLCDLTRASGYPVRSVYRIDEQNDWLYYTAFSAENPYNQQLHRVHLDGTGEQRLTSSGLNHTSFNLAPDHRWIIATRESISTPPETVLYSDNGKQVLVLAKTRIAPEDRKYITGELFSFLADDGKTRIWGTLHKPTNFDPGRKYPLVIDVYGGPHSRGISNRFAPVNPYTAFGFCIAKIGNRGTIERGKAFESATYLKLGGPDLDDQAAGVRELANRDYIDSSRVGIYGHSYGGYMSALALLRYPDVFHVGVAGAPVTKWENYDTIYTERYMRTPQENREGYEGGSCMKYAGNLKGKLLLVHGLIDDNVHPANTWQLVQALHQANRRFDLQIYPGFKHGIGSNYFQLRWEFLIKNLKPQSN